MNWKCWIFGHELFVPTYGVEACERCGQDSYHEPDTFASVWGGLWWLYDLWETRYDMWYGYVRGHEEARWHAQHDLTMLKGRLRDRLERRWPALETYNVTEKCWTCGARFRRCDLDCDHLPF